MWVWFVLFMGGVLLFFFIKTLGYVCSLLMNKKQRTNRMILFNFSTILKIALIVHLSKSNDLGYNTGPNVQIDISLSDIVRSQDFYGNLFNILRGTVLQRINERNPSFTDLLENLNESNLTLVFHNIMRQLADLQASYEALNASKVSGGTTYTIWGRKSCTNLDTELVYSGYAGGSDYSHTGAAAEYVCLPQDKLNFSNVFHGPFTYMYGAEYQLGNRLHNQDAPCAVCRSDKYISTVMVPARSQCYNGWERIYHGILVAGLYSHEAASTFICLEENPEMVTRGENNDNGKLMYAVTTVCGSLPCPPYINNSILTCVLCGK